MSNHNVAGTHNSPTERPAQTSSSSAEEDNEKFLTPRQRADGSYYIPSSPNSQDGVPSSVPATPEAGASEIQSSPQQLSPQQQGPVSSSSSSALGNTNVGITWTSTFEETNARQNNIHATFQTKGKFNRDLFQGMSERKIRRKVPENKLGDYSMTKMLQGQSVRNGSRWEAWPDEFNGTGSDFDLLLDLATGVCHEQKYHTTVAFVSRTPMPLPCCTRRLCTTDPFVVISVSTLSTADTHLSLKNTPPSTWITSTNQPSLSWRNKNNVCFKLVKYRRSRLEYLVSLIPPPRELSHGQHFSSLSKPSKPITIPS